MAGAPQHRKGEGASSLSKRLSHHLARIQQLAPDEYLVGPELALGALEDWKLLELVAQSDLTRVYRAVHLTDTDGNGIEVALKVARHLVPVSYDFTTPNAMHVARAEVAKKRLSRELWVTQEVSHPHLLWLIADGLGHRPGFLAFPWIEGETLATVLQQSHGPAAAKVLPLPKIVWIARHLAEALAALHAQGWIHTQIQPSHVMVGQAQGAMLLDYSRAVITGSEDTFVRSTIHTALPYAAPELFVKGGEYSFASDVYALSALLFQLLTGRPPFVGSGAEEIALAHLRDEAPDVRDYFYHAPLKLAQVLRQGLAKEPLRRPSAQEMVQRLVEAEISTLASW